VRLLVTGGAGYLGSELCAQAVAQGLDVLATQFRAPVPHGRAVRLDIRDADAAQRVFLRHGPSVVVHTAYVQQDAPTIVQGSAAVAAAAHRSGARLVHVSTDLVFDGEQGAPYDEGADPRPVSAYGAAKLEAERVVARTHPDALLVRTSLLYGKPGGPQEALAFAEGVELFTDEIRCPTLVSELAAALLELAELDVTGLLHVAAPEAVSRYDLGRLLRAKHGGDPDAIHGASTPKGRARNVSLDSSRAARLLETRLRGASEALGG
jgi:dTDP-4-dehydrorhamnose reductase